MTLRRAAANAPWAAGGLMIALLAIMAVLILAPLVTLVATSLAWMPGTPWNFSAYAALASPDVWVATRNTLGLALSGTVIAMVFGCGLAWLASRTDVPAKGLVHLAGIIPLFLSVLVASIAWSVLASGRSGYLNLMFRDLGVPIQLEIQSMPGIAFVFGLYYAPYPFLLVHSALDMIHPDLEEAAGVHGASFRRTLSRVTFPLVKPAIVGAALLVFALMIEDFPVPQILGGPVGIDTVSMRIYKLMTQVPQLREQASALSIILVVVIGAFLFGQRALLRGADHRTVTGKGMRPRVLPLGRWRWPAFAFVLVYIVLAIVLPALALLESALRRSLFVRNVRALFDPSQLTFAPIARALADPAIGLAALNSVVTALATAVFGTTLFFIVAVVVHRTRIRGRQILEYIAMVPVAVPALVMGLGILATWVAVPLPVYGTLGILVIAYISRFFPQGYRAISASIARIHEDLENAALVAGAGRLRVLWRITLPLARGGVAASFALLVILALRELTASLLLYTTNTRVLSIAIYEMYVSGSWSSVAAISLAYTVVLVLVTLAGRRWMRAAT